MLVEDTVMSGLGGCWWRFGGRYSNELIGWCWTLGLVEVWWRFGGRYSNEWIGWCWTLGLVEVWWKIQ